MVKEKAAAKQRAAFKVGSAKDLQKKAENALRPALVDVYRAARLDRGVKLTRQQARKEMAQRQADENARAAEAKREQLASLEKSIADNARENVAASLNGLAIVRAMLEAMADGKRPYGLEADDNAAIIGTFLLKHAAKLEQALFQLQVWEGEKVRGIKRPQAIFAGNDLYRIE